MGAMSLVSLVSGGGIGGSSPVSSAGVSTGGAMGGMMVPGQPMVELATSNSAGRCVGFMCGG